jgi:Tol biopolymer transport system component/tRNA A-37 threonylcarbamoyl transferase component Bud32
MLLTHGDKLGPYEILAPLGAGGMGEVYKARDTRLDRIVALKVLRSMVAHEDRLLRFEREARAAGSLNHPNILAIYDIGTQDGMPYVVSELLEGETLHDRMRTGKLGTRKAAAYALQIAQGMAAAHDKGVVHRDLKPANLFVTRDGRVKILDFGLAKLMETRQEPDTLATRTIGPETEPGVVLGTPGYMSPEQVRADSVDERSDLFSFGAIFFEMLSGRRAFAGDSTVEVLNAILKEEPPEIGTIESPLFPALDRVMRRCLEKDPGERFQSAQDLAFALDVIGSHTGSGSGAAAEALPKASTRKWLLLATVAAGMVVLCAGAYWVGRRAIHDPPSFHALLFRHGYIRGARFTPDGQSVVYSAGWDGKPDELFVVRVDNPEAKPLGIASASLLSVSRTGEMAVGLDYHNIAFLVSQGKLARVALLGGGPRDVLEDVMDADFSSDGKSMAVVRRVGATTRLEFPPGKIVCETPGWFSQIRFSAKGDRIAMLEHPIWGDDRGWLVVTDLIGTKKRLSADSVSAIGVAWAPSDGEIWYSALENDNTWSIFAVNPSSARARIVTRAPRRLMLHDVAADGRALISHETDTLDLGGKLRGDSSDHAIPCMLASVAADIAPDGSSLLALDYGNSIGYVAMSYRSDGSSVKLGDGWPGGFSPDGKWIVSIVPSQPMKLLLLPVGIGQSRSLEAGPVTDYQWTDFAGDQKHVIFAGSEKGHAGRIYLQDVAGGPPRAVSGDGYTVAGHALSPDGKMIVVTAPEGRAALLPLDGGIAKPLPSLETSDQVIRWTPDGRRLLVYRVGQIPARIEQLDLTSGKRELVREVAPADRSGVQVITQIAITGDAQWYGYSFRRALDELNVMTIGK